MLVAVILAAILLHVLPVFVSLDDEALHWLIGRLCYCWFFRLQIIEL